MSTFRRRRSMAWRSQAITKLVSMTSLVLALALSAASAVPIGGATGGDIEFDVFLGDRGPAFRSTLLSLAPCYN